MPVATKVTYNLVRESWIPCVDLRGRPVTLGLSGVLEQAPGLRDLAVGSPIARVALYRLLLAVLYRVHVVADPDEWEELAGRGWDAAPLTGYLERWESRFDLFSESVPFFQRADLDTGGDTPVTKLTPEYAAGNNKQLVDHSADDNPPALSTAEAARALVVAQAWSIGGGKSGAGRPNYTSAPLARGLCIVPLGENLAQTLLMNLVPRLHLQGPIRGMPSASKAGQDLPVWERAEEPMVAERRQAGICDYLTWPVRYIRLVAEEDGRVRFTHIAQGVKLPEGIVDLHHAFAKQKATDSVLPRGLSPDRAAWRDAESLFARGEEGSKHTSVPLGFLSGDTAKALGLQSLTPVLVAGMAVPGGQPPPDIWCADLFRIPSDLIDSEDRHEAMCRGLQLSKEVAAVVRSAVWIYASSFLAPANGSADSDAVKKLAHSLCRELDYWAALEAPFHRFLAALAETTEEEAHAEWSEKVKAAALAAFEASLSSQDRTGRHWKARCAAEGAFWSTNKGLRQYIPDTKPTKEEATDDDTPAGE